MPEISFFWGIVSGLGIAGLGYLSYKRQANKYPWSLEYNQPYLYDPNIKEGYSLWKIAGEQPSSHRPDLKILYVYPRNDEIKIGKINLKRDEAKHLYVLPISKSTIKLVDAGQSGKRNQIYEIERQDNQMLHYMQERDHWRDLYFAVEKRLHRFLISLNNDMMKESQLRELEALKKILESKQNITYMGEKHEETIK